MSRWCSRSGLLGLSLSLALGAQLAPPLPAQEVADERTFAGAAEVVLVEVPVRVVLDGRPITGLTAADFELFDRGDRQEITYFEVLDSRPSDSSNESQVAAEARNYLFLIDLAYPARAGPAYSRSILTTSRELHLNVRSLAEFLASGLGPRDRWALAYHSPLRGVRLVQPWSSDPEAIASSIELLDAIALGKPKRADAALAEWRSRIPELGAELARFLPSDEDLVAEARTASVRADPFLPQLKTIEKLAGDLTDLTDALDETLGPTYLVYLSGGFPLSEDGTSAAILDRLQRLFRVLRTTGWSIEALNPIGVDLGAGSLFLITHETGGELHTNSRKLGELLDRVVAHTSYSYVLGFHPTELDPDGAFHRLKVRLVEKPAGAEVIHRRGYYATEAASNDGATRP